MCATACSTQLALQLHGAVQLRRLFPRTNDPKSWLLYNNCSSGIPGAGARSAVHSTLRVDMHLVRSARLLCMLALCALALPMLALRAPAVRALAVHARAVRVRAVRVVCLCSAHLHHAELVDIADNTPLINPSSTPAT